MEDPERYSRSNPFQRKDANYVLGKYKINTDDEDVILDIGCGPGDVTSEILAPSLQMRFRQLIGVDCSSEMVNFAKENFSENRIRYEVLDISRDVTDFTDEHGTFSKIFSFYCLHWIKDLPTALTNIRKLMSQGGQCLLVFVAESPVFTMYERMANLEEWKKYMSDVNDYIPDTHHTAQAAVEFSDLMKKAGFSSTECKIEDTSFLFSSTEFLRACVVAINPFVQRLDETLQDEYIGKCLKTLEEIQKETGPVNQNEPLLFSYKLLVALGKKN